MRAARIVNAALMLAALAALLPLAGCDSFGLGASAPTPPPSRALDYRQDDLASVVFALDLPADLQPVQRASTARFDITTAGKGDRSQASGHGCDACRISSSFFLHLPDCPVPAMYGKAESLPPLPASPLVARAAYPPSAPLYYQTLPHTKAVPSPANFQEVEKIFIRYYTAMMADEMSIADGCKQADQELNDSFSRLRQQLGS